MNAIERFAAIALVAVPVIAAAGCSAPVKGDQELKCSDMLYSQEFLAKNPKAPAACQEVVAKNGEKYARFWGEVTEVKGNLVTVSFKNVRGDSLAEVTIDPKPEAKVTIEGKSVKFSSLTKGQRLDVWVPEGRYGFYATPGESALQRVD